MSELSRHFKSGSKLPRNTWRFYETNYGTRELLKDRKQQRDYI